jgi:hypothetical protein
LSQDLAFISTVDREAADKTVSPFLETRVLKFTRMKPAMSKVQDMVGGSSTRSPVITRF